MSGPKQREILSLIQSWRASLGLQPEQGESVLPDAYQRHVQLLRQALQEESVQDWQALEAVFRTAIELCVTGSTNSELLLTHDTDLSALTAPAAMGRRASHGEPSLSSMSDVEAISVSEQTHGGAASTHSDDEKPASVGSMVGEREFVRPMEFFTSSRASIEIYERFGGWDLFSGAVGEMYTRLNNDPRTARFFVNRPRERLMQHMTGFLSTAMLGRCMYRPEQLFRMHCPMMQNEGLGPEHVDIMCKHMEEVLSDLGASEETVESAVRVLQSQKYIFNHVVHESDDDRASEATEGGEPTEHPPFEVDEAPAAGSKSIKQAAASCPFAAHAAHGMSADASACPFMTASK